MVCTEWFRRKPPSITRDDELPCLGLRLLARVPSAFQVSPVKLSTTSHFAVGFCSLEGDISCEIICARDEDALPDIQYMRNDA